MKLTYGSVCSGIEAASVAWEPLGFKPAWFSQFDPEHNYKNGPDYPSSVLAHHWPEVENLGDMTRIAGLIRFGEIEAPDLIVGGTPCQSFSIAGMRAGLTDQRGQLTLAYVELADAIDSVRAEEGKPPTIVVWENVPGVLSSKDNAFGCLLAALAGDVEPYSQPTKRGGGSTSWSNSGVVFGPKRAIAWRVVDAQYFGLAQRRRRVFLIASARDDFHPAQVLLEFDGVRRDIAPSRAKGQSLTHDIAPSLTGSGRGVERVGDTRGQDPVVAVALRGHDGGDEPHFLCPVLAFGGNNQSGPIEVATARNACSSASGRLEVESETFIVRPAFAVRTANTGANGQGISPELAHTLDLANGQCVAFDTTQITSPQNASNPQPGQPCHPLAATAHAPLIVWGGQAHVRRLLPVECERLQGFPDGYTDIIYRGKPVTDGHRYKALGNSMATHCMRWLGGRIVSALEKPWGYRL